ncbi:hypothetical protein Tco_0679713 [Tanacetum coccineum]|uniref:Uncharacterized protein n=1 Tax=Tanacetum coccineum TaxID=301880 RepID=A0ABQ4XIL7_9ASTR
MISVNNLKTDSENSNEKTGVPSFPPPKPTTNYIDDLDFFNDFENEFPAIVYNDAQTSKSNLLTEPILSPQHIDELNLNDETSVSEYDEEEQNTLYFNDIFLFNIIRPDDLKSEKDNNDNDIDIIKSSEGNEITHRSNMLMDSSSDKIDKIFDKESFVLELNVNIICIEVDDTWAWVAMGTERQPDAAAGAPTVAEDAHAADEGDQRLRRLQDEVQGLRRDVGTLRGLMERSMTDQGRFSTWMMLCKAQLMDASRLTYQAFDGIFRGSSPAAF